MIEVRNRQRGESWSEWRPLDFGNFLADYIKRTTAAGCTVRVKFAEGQRVEWREKK